jgi:hypothetical protein
MCVMVLLLAKSGCRLVLARKSSHNPTIQIAPPCEQPKMAGRSKAASDACGSPPQRNLYAYLLELLDGTLVNTSALVDQVCVCCELV